MALRSARAVGGRFEPSEPEDYILGINGKILLVQEDDQEIQAGTMQLSYVPLSTVHEEEWSAFDVLDSLSDTAQ